MPARGIAHVSTVAPTREQVTSGRQLTALPTGGYGQRTNAPLSGQEIDREMLRSADVPTRDNLCRHTPLTALQ